LAPHLELDIENLVTLCMGDYDCHLKLGHGGSFRCYNPRVREDAVAFGSSSLLDRRSILEEARKGRRSD
jgi:hypothetical protein